MSKAKRIAAELPAEELDILIFATGIMAVPKRQVTAEGIERDLANQLSESLCLMQREMAHRLDKNRAEAAMGPCVFNLAFPGQGAWRD